MRVGVLALQGDFAEHRRMLNRLAVDSSEVRLPGQLEGLDGLIIPGGESTTIGKLAKDYDLIDPLQQFGETHAVWGTCAGAIFLAKDVHRDQPLLKLMDITIERNAFGRQTESFVTELDVNVLEEPDRPFPAVFIRAPIIEDVAENVEVIARLANNHRAENGPIVCARQGHLLASSFHPELTMDDRFHRYFLTMVNA
jgi:5'-phosphate synthase pdxT subunit